MSPVGDEGPAAGPDATEHARGSVDPVLLGELARSLRGHLREAGETVPSDDLVFSFLATALRRLPPEVLIDVASDAATLAGALAVVLEREPGSTRIDVVPAAEGHGTPTTLVRIVCDDRPFLLSTVTSELDRRGLGVRRGIHPVLGIERDAHGVVTAIVPARGARSRDAVMLLEVEHASTRESAAGIASDLRRLLDDVMLATGAHGAMRARLHELASEVAALPVRTATGADDAPDEVADLLRWLDRDTFVLLGMRDYRLDLTVDPPVYGVVDGSGLGVLTDTSRSTHATPRALGELPDPLRERLEDPRLLSFNRTRALATVQRRTQMASFRVVRHVGGVVVETRIVGLFSRKGLAEPSGTVPVLRARLVGVLDDEDIVDGSADAVALTSLFGMIPKDEAFAMTSVALRRFLVELLAVEDRHDVWVATVPDRFAGTLSVLAALPRQRYGADEIDDFVRTTAALVGGETIEVDVVVGDTMAALLRIRFALDAAAPMSADTGGMGRVSATEPPPDRRALLDPRALTEELRRATAPYAELVERAIGTAPDAGRPPSSLGPPTPDAAHAATLAGALPASYRARVRAADARTDLTLLALLIELDDHGSPLVRDDDVVVAVTPPHAAEDTTEAFTVHVARRGAPLELSAFAPILESLGLVVVSDDRYPLEAAGAGIELHRFTTRAARPGVAIDAERLADAMRAAWRGHAEVDGMNALVHVAGLTWREVHVLRAYRRLRWQLGSRMSTSYVTETLVRHPDVARLLIALFHARFLPRSSDAEGTEGPTRTVRASLGSALDALTRLDEDRILRGLATLIEATVRTNAYVEHPLEPGDGEPCLALAYDPALVPDIGERAGFREVFVNSPRVEGIHLRHAPVARGGIRLSDRHDDLRTEVLDLAHTQAAKNAIIVPAGAKGGFALARTVPRGPVRPRADEARLQYRRFIGALLEVVDDVADGVAVHPPGVVVHDADDTYLVVAADRGTATFSDEANELAAARGYWLGDAFASGGSNGFDHKALGVTARGAWAAAARHLRALGIDIASEPFTVAGIGDMSGDVFGNAMLLSSSLRLVAAFDHRHVFLDPDPDPAVSFAERRRLAGLAGSSWDDYDRGLISPGGGVHSRADRSVRIGPEVAEALRIPEGELDPDALVRAVLTAPVDLLFAGGIGTFVRSSTERDADMTDRANDEVRVHAASLRARVVVEGANLALTQAARVEFARRGGRVNQDAVDNAAGVSTSDREVNLKVLLAAAIAAGRLAPAERDTTLAACADDVAAAAIADVDRVAASLDREQGRSASDLASYAAVIARLESTIGLDRAAETLPSAEDLEVRATAGAGLTRPELATMSAWTKRWLIQALVTSPVTADTRDVSLVAGAFPRAIVERFGDLLPRHALWRELVSSRLANDVVDRLGITAVETIRAGTGAGLDTIVATFDATRRVLEADRWWAELDALPVEDPLVGDARTLSLADALGDLVTALTVATLADDAASSSSARAALTEVVAAVLDGFDTIGGPVQRHARAAHARWLIDDLVPPGLARLLGSASALEVAPDAVRVLTRGGAGRDPSAVMHTLLVVSEAMGIDALVGALARVEAEGAWALRQRTGLAEDLRDLRVRATIAALDGAAAVTGAGPADTFLTTHRRALEGASALVTEACHDGGSLDAIAVAVRSLTTVARAWSDPDAV